MSQAAIDPVIFSEISVLMEDALPVFIETYLENTQKLIALLEQSVPTGDAEGVFQNAHQLKGGSGSIGAMKVFQIAKQMEDVAKEGGTEDQLSVLFVELKDAFVAAETELKVHL